MSYTKEEVIEKINKSFSDLKDKTPGSDILINRLVENAGFKAEEKSEILELFGVNKYADVLQTLDQYEVYIPDGKKDKAVRKRQSEEQMCNTITKENKMPETTKHHDRIAALKNALSEGLYEKDEALRLALLAAIAGESIFFLGAPGCAKSMLARRIAQAFKADGDGSLQYFETLLNQFSTPEDVFGNISLKALNGELEDEQGNKKEEYRRLTENMLPEADIAFLDEIWKASPAILNTLLTIINERKFHNGSKVQDVPLKALLAASNELPAKDRGLEALYDRFIIRLPIGFIQNEDSFFDMVEGSSSEFELSDEIKKLQISNEDLKNWKTQIDAVQFSEESRAVISAIRKELTVQNETLSEEEKAVGESFAIGDRRWKKIVRILKTSAFLNDRTEVDLMDCQLIEYCIWSTGKQQKKVRQIVETCIQQNGLDCDTAIDDINDRIEEFTAKVEQDWFKTVKVAEKTRTDPATDKIVTVDDQECYECTRDGTNETWYVSVARGKHDPWNDYHDIYDSNKNHYTRSSFRKSGSKISCYHNFTVKKNPEQIVVIQPATSYRKQKEYSDIAQETLQKNFDKAYYKPIVDEICSEIKALKDKKEADAIPFKANLFANQSYNKSLTAKLDEAIRQFEDAEIALAKQHDRYFNAELDTDFSEGDVILKDGTAFSSEEIKNLTEEQKKNVIAVVCIADDKTFALGISEKKLTWNALKEYALHYGDALPKDYAANWIVPDKAQLYAIWENRDKLNTSFEALGIEEAMLTPQEYWSASENGEAAAFYQLFDENGLQDHTTKDHVYAVRTIREWSKI